MRGSRTKQKAIGLHRRMVDYLLDDLRRLAKVPSDGGMTPLKTLGPKSNTSRLTKFDISVGIAPLKRFPVVMPPKISSSVGR
jgi:hypothetical protein